MDFIIGLRIATAIAPITGLIGTAIPLIGNATNMTVTAKVWS